jgi:methanogenic corrinoid protein MtbC1
MIGDFLESAGWEVIQLGASVPAEALAGLVSDESPDAVGLSTATPALLDGAQRALALLGELDPRPFVAVGGRAWSTAGPARATELGADLCVPGPLELARELTERFPAIPDA